MVRLKHLARLHTECTSSGTRPYVALEHIDSWTGDLLTSAELPERTPTRAGMVSIEPGDVLFGKLRPYLAKTWLVDRPALASTELLCMRTFDGVESRWFGYLTMTSQFVGWAVATSEGTKMPRTSWEKVGAYRSWLPPEFEQQAIADYLDTETGRIDALISKKRRLVELLQERRRALITAAVDPDRHNRQDVQGGGLTVSVLRLDQRKWSRVQVRHIARIEYGSSLPAVDRVEGDVTVFGSNGPVGQHDRSNTGAPVLVLGRKGSYGKLHFSSGPIFAIDTTFYIDPTCTQVRLKWLYYILSTLGLDRLGQDVGVPGLSREYAYSQRVPLPSPHEQRAIANFLDTETARIDTLVAKIARTVELLQERRSALITAAVTGEINVDGSSA